MGEMMLLEHVVAVNLCLGMSSLSDQEICSILLQAEGLPLVALDLTMTGFSGTGLALGGMTLNVPQLEKMNLSYCSCLNDTMVGIQ